MSNIPRPPGLPPPSSTPLTNPAPSYAALPKPASTTNLSDPEWSSGSDGCMQLQQSAPGTPLRPSVLLGSAGGAAHAVALVHASSGGLLSPHTSGGGAAGVQCSGVEARAGLSTGPPCSPHHDGPRLQGSLTWHPGHANNRPATQEGGERPSSRPVFSARVLRRDVPGGLGLQPQAQPQLEAPPADRPATPTSGASAGEPWQRAMVIGGSPSCVEWSFVRWKDCQGRFAGAL